MNIENKNQGFAGKNSKKPYCNNCGQTNHYYRECKYPITSYGIICYQYIDKELKYLIIRRRNSLSYVEFLRGRYKITNIKFLLVLFKNMTIDERKLIKNANFDMLWSDLWLNNRGNRDHRNEFHKGMRKFNELKNGIYLSDGSFVNIDSLIDSTSKESIYTVPEWSFPKGRRNAYESDLECAKREFIEETNYSNDDYKLIDADTFEEEHLGSNNISYKTVYYLANFLSDGKEAILNKYNKIQLNEIGDIGWFSYDEMINIYRSYHTEKLELIKQVDNFLVYKCKKDREEFKEN